MSKDWLTDDQIEDEIEKLRDSDDVRLARLELRMKYKRRQTLYQLRNLEKRGKELRSAGITEEILKAMTEEEIGKEE